MGELFSDARLEELQFLTKLSAKGSVTLKPKYGPQQDMIAFLVQSGLA